MQVIWHKKHNRGSQETKENIKTGMTRRNKTLYYHLFLALLINAMFLVGLAHLTNVNPEHSIHGKLFTFSISTETEGYQSTEKRPLLNETDEQLELQEIREQNFPSTLYKIEPILDCNTKKLEMNIPKVSIPIPSLKIKHPKIKKIASLSKPSAHTRTKTLQQAVGKRGSKNGVPGKNGGSSASGIYGLQEVDIPPKIVKKIIPLYPIKARKYGIEGTLVVKFLVDVDGEVKDLKIISAKPKGFFENTVFNSIKKWRFIPGKKDGRIVKTVMILPIQFRLSN